MSGETAAENVEGPAPEAKPDWKPPTRPTFFEMALALNDEVDRREIVWRLMAGMNTQPTERERRTVAAFKRAAQILQLVEVHEAAFAELVKKARGKR